MNNSWTIALEAIARQTSSSKVGILGIEVYQNLLFNSRITIHKLSSNEVKRQRAPSGLPPYPIAEEFYLQ